MPDTASAGTWSGSAAIASASACSRRRSSTTMVMSERIERDDRMRMVPPMSVAGTDNTITAVRSPKLPTSSADSSAPPSAPIRKM